MKVKVRFKIRYDDHFGEPEWLVAQYKVGRSLLYENIMVVPRTNGLDLFLYEVNRFLGREDMMEELKKMIIKDIKSGITYKYKKRTNKEKERELLNRLKNIKFEFEINDKDLK